MSVNEPREYPKTFETFKRQVNNAVARRIGCGIYDLPDSICWDDYWHEDCERDVDDFWNGVEAATEDVLVANGFELDPYPV
jgi:hypothetical protein|tara:strand:- start:897 stop:1139 length:243 start_codon:yes stop_codon:yes gene_type:complete